MNKSSFSIHVTIVRSLHPSNMYARLLVILDHNCLFTCPSITFLPPTRSSSTPQLDPSTLKPSEQVSVEAQARGSTI
jgi:hypothetical protein